MSVESLQSTTEICWRIDIGAVIGIYRNGNAVQSPPNKTVVILFLGLFTSGSEWSPRKTLAERLYPQLERSAKRTALRQSLHRLREWLGPDAIEMSDDVVRLAGCSFDLDLPHHEQIHLVDEILPEFDHPWIDSLRRHWFPRAKSRATLDLATQFISTVTDAARADVDLARGLLVGGSRLLVTMKASAVSDLLALTRPKDRLSPASAEHTLLFALLLIRTANFRSALPAFVKAHKLALETGDRALISTTASFTMFALLEAGHLRDAEEWFGELNRTDRSPSTRLLLSNARAAYFWNLNRLDEALALYGEATSLVSSAERSQAAHFWSNYAVLAAEAGEVCLSKELAARCKTLIQPGQDHDMIQRLRLAKAEQLVHRGFLAEALERLNAAACQEREEENHLIAIYSDESAASVLAKMGRLSEARQRWRTACEERARTGGKRSLRVVAREQLSLGQS